MSSLRPFWKLAALAAVLFLGACESDRRLSDAMAAFDQGVIAEQRALARRALQSDARLPEPAVGAGLSATFHFQQALTHLEKIGPGDKDFMVQARTWGLKQAVHAQVLWKLGQYDRAYRLAQSIGTLPEGSLGTRDAFIVAALPALIRNDQAHRLIHLKERSDGDGSFDQDFMQANRLLSQAMTDFENLRLSRAKDAPALQLAAIRWLLGAYENLADAYTFFGGGRSIPDGPGPNCQAYKALFAMHQMIEFLKRRPNQTLLASDEVLAPRDTTVADLTRDQRYWANLSGINRFSDDLEADYCTAKG